MTDQFFTDFFIRDLVANPPQPKQIQLTNGTVREVYAQAIYYDKELRGFGVRIGSNGYAAFIVNYRVAGVERRMTLGPWGVEFKGNRVKALPGCLTVEAAREKARRYRDAAKDGVDYQAVLEQQRPKPVEVKAGSKDRSSMTFEELFEKHRELGFAGLRAKTKQSYESTFRSCLQQRIGSTPVRDLTRERVLQIRKELEAVPYQANDALALIRKLFNWANVTLEAFKAKPLPLLVINGATSKGGDFFKENPRSHCIRSPEEIARFRSVLEQMRGKGVAYCDTADVAELCLLIGCRIGEILAAKWKHFVFEVGTWEAPAENRKTGETVVRSLTGAQLAIIQRRRTEHLKRLGKGVRTLDGEAYVFPSTEGHRRDIDRKAWNAIRKEFGDPLLRPHDLKRTKGTLMRRKGYSIREIADSLGNKDEALIARAYAHVSVERTREVEQEMGNLFEASLESFKASGRPSGPAPVVKMPRTRKGASR